MLDRIRSRFSFWTCLSFLRAESAWRRVEGKLRDERGAITIEYILIIAIIIITVFTVLLWPFLKDAVADLVDRIVNAINGGNIS